MNNSNLDHLLNIIDRQIINESLEPPHPPLLIHSNVSKVILDIKTIIDNIYNFTINNSEYELMRRFLSNQTIKNYEGIIHSVDISDIDIEQFKNHLRMRYQQLV